MLKITLA